MTYQSKLDTALEYIAEHNQNVEDQHKIDPDAFQGNLKASGGTSEAALSACSYEDLEELGLPKLLAKRIASVFRQKETQKNRYRMSPRRAEMTSIYDLLENYDPSEVDSPVVKELKKRSNDGPFIVFNSDNSVDTEVSVKLFSELQEGFEPRTIYTDPDGEQSPRSVYKPGDRPGFYLERNPIFPAESLRFDGTCMQTNRNFASIGYDLRRLLYIAIHETKEISINNMNDVHHILDIAVTNPQQLWSRYQYATQKFKEKEERGELPPLKMSNNDHSKRTKKNDPFHGSSHVTY